MSDGGDDGRRDGEADPFEGVDLSDLDVEDWEAIEAAIAELRDLGPSERARRFDEWRRRSVAAAFLTAVFRGLEDVFRQRDLGEQVEIDASGPPDDDPFRLRLDKDPQASVMVIKPGTFDASGD